MESHSWWLSAASSAEQAVTASGWRTEASTP